MTKEQQELLDQALEILKRSAAEYPSIIEVQSLPGCCNVGRIELELVEGKKT